MLSLGHLFEAGGLSVSKEREQLRTTRHSEEIERHKIDRLIRVLEIGYEIKRPSHQQSTNVLVDSEVLTSSCVHSRNLTIRHC